MVFATQNHRGGCPWKPFGRSDWKKIYRAGDWNDPSPSFTCYLHRLTSTGHIRKPHDIKESATKVRLFALFFQFVLNKSCYWCFLMNTFIQSRVESSHLFPTPFWAWDMQICSKNMFSCCLPVYLCFFHLFLCSGFMPDIFYADDYLLIISILSFLRLFILLLPKSSYAWVFSRFCSLFMPCLFHHLHLFFAPIGAPLPTVMQRWKQEMKELMENILAIWGTHAGSITYDMCHGYITCLIVQAVSLHSLVLALGLYSWLRCILKQVGKIPSQTTVPLSYYPL